MPTHPLNYLKHITLGIHGVPFKESYCIYVTNDRILFELSRSYKQGISVCSFSLSIKCKKKHIATFWHKKC